MSFDVGDIEGLKLQLRRMGDVTEVTNQELKRLAVTVQEKAKNMAPIDYEDLIDSIQIRETAGRGALGRFVKGVREYEVYINMNHSVDDPDKQRAGVQKVGEYAWKVHEHMGWGSTPGSILIHGMPFMPNKDRNTGPNGEERGGKFIERAALELEPLIAARLSRVVKKYFEVLDN